MRKILAALVAIGLSVPLGAMAETWEKVPLIDQMCAQKEKVKAHPENHPTGCLIKCSGSGYGVMTSSGNYLKLDEAGNQKALAALKATKKENDIRVNVSGQKEGDMIKVASLKIAE
jgi:hypothetical protein